MKSIFKTYLTSEDVTFVEQLKVAKEKEHEKNVKKLHVSVFSLFLYIAFNLFKNFMIDTRIKIEQFGCTTFRSCDEMMKNLNKRKGRKYTNNHT